MIELDGKTSGEEITGNGTIFTLQSNWSPSTTLFWVYLDDLAAADMIFMRQNWSTGNTSIFQQFSFDSRLAARISRQTSNAQAVTGDGFLESGKWLFLALTYTSGGSGPRWFKGALDSPVAEASSYITRTDGSGLMTFGPSGSSVWLNTVGGGAFSIDGRCAMIRFIDRDLNIDQLEALRNRPFRPRPLDRFHWIPGLYGLTDILDLSGNGRHGTGAGLAYGDGLPLPITFEDTRRSRPYGAIALTPSIAQDRYRHFEDDGGEAAHTARAAENTTTALAPGEQIRTRVTLDVTGDPASIDPEWQYRLPIGAAWRKLQIDGKTTVTEA